MTDDTRSSFLICRIATRLCALPLAHVVETMRPLPIERMDRAPAFVRGISVVRGAPTPVVDGARLLGERSSGVERFVSLVVDGRAVALAVDTVLGVRALARSELRGLPPLIGATGEVVAELGALEAELLLVLRSARIVPAALAPAGGVE